MQELYAMLRHKFGTYWNQTETYEALKIYIQMDMDGLQDAVVRMLAGEAIKINTGTFSNDMTTFASKDDVLTLLVHLGYPVGRELRAGRKRSSYAAAISCKGNCGQHLTESVIVKIYFFKGVTGALCIYPKAIIE